jgi:hypothetical protein
VVVLILQYSCLGSHNEFEEHGCTGGMLVLALYAGFTPFPQLLIAILFYQIMKSYSVLYIFLHADDNSILKQSP